MLLLSTLGQYTISTSDAVPRPPIEPTLLLGAATRAFLSRTLGNHMVLQAAPQKATVWGATTPGAVVTTTFDGVNWTATADQNGTWRQQLPPTPASSLQSRLLLFASSSGETAKLQDVLFGEVFVCGGQSNMEMAVPAVTNSSTEAQTANAYPHIRIFSVGHGTSSATPLLDLQTVWEPWQVASNTTIREDFGPGHTLFSTFSAVCWFFGRSVADALARRAGAPVPVGLVSNNWGGTKLEVWTPPDAFGACGRTVETAPMYNAMIVPYTVGPMALAGFTWCAVPAWWGYGEGGVGTAAACQQHPVGVRSAPRPFTHPPPALALPTGTKGRPTWRTPTRRHSPRRTPVSSPG